MNSIRKTAVIVGIRGFAPVVLHALAGYDLTSVLISLLQPPFLMNSV